MARKDIHIHIHDSGFKESDHPRGKEGRFAETAEKIDKHLKKNGWKGAFYGGTSPDYKHKEHGRYGSKESGAGYHQPIGGKEQKLGTSYEKHLEYFKKFHGNE